MNKYIKRLSAALLFSSFVIFSACSAGRKEEVPELVEPVGVYIDTVEAVTGDVQNALIYEAQLLPRTEKVTAGTGGTLGKWSAEVGDSVEMGQTLVSLEDEDWTERLKELETRIEDTKKNNSIQNRLAEYDIEILELEWKQLEAQEAAQRDIELKKLDIRIARTKLRHEKERQELSASELEAERDKMYTEQEKWKRKAPISGKVVYICGGKGSQVWEDTIVAVIASEKDIRLRCEYISEWDLEQGSGYYALLHGKQYKIKQIPYEKEEYMAVALSGGTNYSYFAIEGAGDGLTAGDYAQMHFIRQAKEQVLVLPVNAVYRSGSENYVYLMDGGERIKHTVSVGLKSETLVEIIEGLKEGDVVYVRD